MAIDMFLTIEGISGESQRTGHEGEIEVLGWSFGGSNPSSIGIGGGGGAGKVNLQEISITKYLDASSAEIFQAMCKGEHFPTGKMTAYKGGGDALPYLTMEFEEMYPTSQSMGGSGGEEVFTENVTFAFGKVVVTYTEQGAAGTAAGDHVGQWDVRTVSAD